MTREELEVVAAEIHRTWRSPGWDDPGRLVGMFAENTIDEALAAIEDLRQVEASTCTPADLAAVIRHLSTPDPPGTPASTPPTGEHPCDPPAGHLWSLAGPTDPPDTNDVCARCHATRPRKVNDALPIP